MSVNFILIGGIEELAKRNYEDLFLYKKEQVANNMIAGKFEDAAEDLFNSSIFNQIFNQRNNVSSVYT